MSKENLKRILGLLILISTFFVFNYIESLESSFRVNGYFDVNEFFTFNGLRAFVASAMHFCIMAIGLSLLLCGNLKLVSMK
jgi:hypothetical protein